MKKGMLMQQQGQANGRNAFLQDADGPGRHAVESPAIAHDKFRYVLFPGEMEDGFLQQRKDGFRRIPVTHQKTGAVHNVTPIHTVYRLIISTTYA